jgi:integrase/recombinase XerD
MKLRDAVESCIAFKRSLGMRFDCQAEILRAFCRAVGNVDLARVQPAAVLAFIEGRRATGASRGYYSRSYYKCLCSFYRYALQRGFARRSPLPRHPPRFPQPRPAYIYSIAELKRLLFAADALSVRVSALHPLTYRTLLLLLYGSAIRIGEALALSLRDVDLAEGMLTVRETKFFKTRQVPLGPRLTRVLAQYARRRRRLPLPHGEASSFFATCTGHAPIYGHVRIVFKRLRQRASIRREGGPREQPRLHDLRHTSATHRLIAWYRSGEDVQRLLPHLATYLGHKDIESTQCYLSLTPQLLQHASRRFAQYALSENRHD